MSHRTPPRLRTARGFGLFDAVVSLAMLAFGMLALTRFEGRLGGLASDSMMRNSASLVAEELTNSMLIDATTSANCYTVPAVAPCTNPAARAATDAWRGRVLARLPNATVTSTVNVVPNRFIVTVTWCPKNCPDANDRRTHQVQSEIRQ